MALQAEYAPAEIDVETGNEMAPGFRLHDENQFLGMAGPFTEDGVDYFNVAIASFPFDASIGVTRDEAITWLKGQMKVLGLSEVKVEEA